MPTRSRSGFLFVLKKKYRHEGKSKQNGLGQPRISQSLNRAQDPLELGILIFLNHTGLDELPNGRANGRIDYDFREQ